MHKSFVFLTVSVLLAGCGSLPPWNPVPTGQSVVYGQIQDSARSIQFTAFASNPGIAAISVESFAGGYTPRYTMVADQAARKTMRDAIAKFQEWSKLATDNSVEITREITTITLTQMFRRGEGWEAEGSRDVTFVFNSRLGQPDDSRITLNLRTSAFFYGVDEIVLTGAQAADFSRYLGDEETDAGWRQAKKKQDTLDLFK
ncbi:MAG: hypothetical protein ACLQDL_18015 [Spirochaetia bacterium]